MTLTLLAALAQDGVIGREGRLPWHLPEDLQRFKRRTLDRSIIMGRKTFESIGKPLPRRRSIVLTRGLAPLPDGVLRAASLDEALALVAGEAEAFVIGGAEVYALALPRADRLELTEVAADVPGDVRFPAFDRSLWREVSREPRGEGTALPFAFVAYERAPGRARA